ncbi:hypothetical protein AFGD_002697 [Aspergillus flavus]|nr:hypothetical protein AFGD_002697 [Aspergillus flavus]
MSKLKLMFRHLWEEFWKSPREARGIFLPKDTFARLQKRIREEATESARTSDQKPFVSDGDILTAWATHTVASSMSKPCPITLEVSTSRIWHLQRMHSSPLSLPGDLLDLLLSVIERHLVEQGTEQQTLGLLKIVRQDIKSAGSPSLFYGDPNASILFVNDLTKMGLIKAANFGPALLSQGDKRKSRSNPPGSMTTTEIIGSKETFPPQAWEIIDKELRDM